MVADFGAIIMKANAWGVCGRKWCRRRSLHISSIGVHWDPLPDFGYAMFTIRSRRRTLSAIRGLASEAGFCLQGSSVGLRIIAARLANA
jgi:hypothetical protein